MRLLLATTNRGKLAELRSKLARPGLELVDLAGVEAPADPAETESTFAGNARLKACYYARHTGLAALADDSGLVVEALGGRPGVHSARLAPTDAGRIAELLGQLEKVPDGRRQAAFVSVIVVCRPDGRILEVEGRVEGEITLRPAGSSGFGYDPVFYFPPLGRTFGQLGPEQKNEVSHRAVALRRLAPRLEAFLAA